MEIIAGDTYVSWWLADLLHSFPHLDLTLQWTNSTFQPSSPQYREVCMILMMISLLTDMM